MKKHISPELALKLFKFYDYIQKKSDYYYFFCNGSIEFVKREDKYKYHWCTRVYAYTMEEAFDIIMPVLFNNDYLEHKLIIEWAKKVYYKGKDSIMLEVEWSWLYDLTEKILNKLADNNCFKVMD